jgi:hypothetical protein
MFDFERTISPPRVVRTNIPADGALDSRERWLAKPFEPARLARLVCKMAPPCPKPPRRVRGMDVMR